MAEGMNTSFYKSVFKGEFRADDMNAAYFITEAARLRDQQNYLDKAQVTAMKSMKFLDHDAVQDISAIHKEMECQRYKNK